MLYGIKTIRRQINNEQGVYFVKTVHFFAATFCSFFTSCLMILFLCKEKLCSNICDRFLLKINLKNKQTLNIEFNTS